jgi:arsenate reductase
MRNILFLCTGNSARSIMAEAYMNHAGRGRWRAYSAGSKPVGAPNPLALTTLKAHDVDVGEPRSKSWDEFAAPGAPPLDVVVTVCDNAAAETCPVWPTRPGSSPPRKLHWSFPDPAAAEGSDADRRAVFESVFGAIAARIDRFLAEERA